MRLMFLRIDAAATQATWQLMERGQPIGPIGRGTLEDAMPPAHHAHVVVMVPSEEIFLTQMALPGKNRNKLLKAVPYAVEDQLVDDIDKLHFVLSNPAATGQYTVAAVDNQTLETWVTALRAAGIRVEAMMPDVLALPADEWTIMIEPERALMRTPLGMFASDIVNLPLLLVNLYEQADADKPNEITVYDCGRGNHIARLEAVVPEINFNVQTCGDGLFGIIGNSYDPRSTLSLLQGDYSVERDFKKHFKPWLTAAGLFLVWFVWQVAYSAFGYVQLYRQSDAMAAQLSQQYKQALPNIKKPDGISERADMERRMKELRKQQGAGAGALAEVLVQAAPVLTQTQGLSLKSLRYIDGKMDIELSLHFTNQLDALKEKLAKQTGWSVEVQSASTRGDSTDVRLQLQRKSG